jgi:hypothetical protein
MQPQPLQDHSRRLVLRYSPGGQFTFRHFRATATDQQLHDIAENLNAFQECPVRKVLKVRVLSF